MHRTSNVGRSSLPQLLLTAIVLLTCGAVQAQNSSEALAINNAGIIVGFSTTSTGANHAVLWQWVNGALTSTDLGALLPSGSNSEATAINNASPVQIVGYATYSSGITHAVEWVLAEGAITVSDLGMLPGGTASEALGINLYGQVVGWSTTSTGAVHATEWAGGAVTDLGTAVYANSEALAINDAGIIVGYSSHFNPAMPPSACTPLEWNKGKILQLSVISYDTLGGKVVIGYAAGATAVAINNKNSQIVGTELFTGIDSFIDYWALEWTNGGNKTPDHLGSPSSQAASATAINDSGQIVGNLVAATAPTAPYGAIEWVNGKVTLLNLPSGTTSPSAAFGLNNSGQIVGFVTTAGLTHAVEWINGVGTDLGTL